jgi:adenylosuccinate lyase
MIERYQDLKIKRIWRKDHRFFLWQKIELIYLNNILKNKNIIPNNEKLYPLQQFDYYMFSEYEKRTKHEMVAFLKELSYRLDIYHEKYPEVNQYLHYGLTSSDIIDTAFSLQIKESLNYLIELITELKAAIETKIKFCKENNIQAIGRTHGKHAEQLPFANRFELFKEEIIYALQLLHQAKSFIYGKLTGPVGTSSFVDKDAAKKTLGELKLCQADFTTQIIPRFYYTHTMYALTVLATFYERFSIFIRLSAINEINEIQEHFSPGQTGSSAMPHKNNPVIAENICGLSRYIKSNLQVALDNNTLWWERDISHSSNERIIWPQSFHLICNLTTKITNLLNTMHLNQDVIQNNLDNSVCDSHEDLLKASLSSTRFDAYEKVQSKYKL